MKPESATPPTARRPTSWQASPTGRIPRSVETARIYVRMLAAVAGDLVLATLPYGGVFLIGGVVRAMQPFLERFGFADAFCDKGRFSEFMTQFPVSVIEDDYAALTGCAVHLAAAAERERG